jgi:hypothetical protein
MKGLPPLARLVLIVLIGVGLLTPALAFAIPAFARKYEVSCNTCHARVYPEINPYGRMFLENGFQLPRGAEEPVRARTTLKPGRERIGLLKEVPLAVRVQSSVLIPTNAQVSNRNTSDFRMLENLFLLSGGAVAKDISYFVAVSLAPDPVLHHGTVGVHNLLGEGKLNLRAGQLLLWDFLRPEHRTVTHIGNLGATVQVGLNPTLLDTSHLGFDAYGRLFARQLFYEAAVVQGAQAADGISDLDGHKDVFGQLQWTFLDRHTLGVLGYRGKTQITDRSRETVVRFTDPFWVAGVDGEGRAGPLGLFGYALYGRHENPQGLRTVIDYSSYRVEATAPVAPDAVMIVRYDRVRAPDDFSLERESLTTHATYNLLANFKIAVEYEAAIGDFDLSTVSFRLDLAL